jgi:hypothetical protein
MRSPTDRISEFVHERYIRPALERGGKTVTIETSEVYFSFHRRYSLDLMSGVLGSMKFRNTYHVALESSQPFGRAYSFRLDLGRAARA